MEKHENGTQKNSNPDLSQKWLKYLREATKTAVVLPCRICRDRKIYQSEDILWAHVLEVHPEKVPKDKEPLEKFRTETLKPQTSSLLKSRPRDDSVSKPHEDLALVESESSKPQRDNLGSTRSLPTYSTPLTKSRLQTLGTEFEKEESADKKRLDALATKSIKKRAIGDSRLLSLSVRTTCSNDSSRRRLVKGISLELILSSQSQVCKTHDLDRKEIVRPPASGKCLFQPDSDSPFAAQTSVAGNTSQSTSQRPRCSLQQPQHWKNQKSDGQAYNQLYASGGKPGIFSASVPAKSSASNKQETPPPPKLLKIVCQPETRPISQEQLVAEVKDIYAGLVMVEGKCVQVDAKQAALSKEALPGTQPKLNNEQWQALIALHRTLLHEHHDFFLTSQHLGTTLAVPRPAIKYAIPARLWRHGIYSFLKLLCNQLLDSLDYMLAFIYLAYSMILLYEIVPAFVETWIECSGDLGCYRIAIEDDDIHDREVWTQVAQQWYLKASGRSPETGRLYHHLAILARPNALQQLFFYLKALIVPQPFVAARKSILTLFQSTVEGKQARQLHNELFARTPKDDNRSLSDILKQIHKHTRRLTRKVSGKVSDITPRSNWSIVSNAAKRTARFANSRSHFSTSANLFYLAPVSLMFLPTTAAYVANVPITIHNNDTASAFICFFEIEAKRFVDETAGPLLLNLCYALGLTISYAVIIILDRTVCKEWDLLLTVMVTTSLGLVFVATDEHYTKWQLAMLWVFTASFIVSYLKEKLVDLKMSGINALMIICFGLGAAVLLAAFVTFPDRLVDPWILGPIAVLPCITFFTITWTAFFYQTKLASNIENGSYTPALLNAFRAFYTAIQMSPRTHPSELEKSLRDVEAQVPELNNDTVPPTEEKIGQNKPSLIATQYTTLPVKTCFQNDANKPKLQKQRQKPNSDQKPKNTKKFSCKNQATLSKGEVYSKEKSI